MQRKLLPRTSSQSIVQKMLGVRTWLRSSTTVASQRRWLSGRKDVACELAASSIRFGAGVTAEIGMDLKELKARNVVVFTDPHLRDLPVVHTVLDSLADNGIRAHVFDQVRVEPNDISFQRAIAYMNKLAVSVDAIVAVGGGSVIDTAKIANLYSMFPPDDFYDYVNPPVGKGIPVPGALRPLFAIPTTAGTGSETTGVAIFDDTRTKSKTGVAHRRLKSTLGIVDPLNTATLPPNVAKYSGFDVLCHAIESFTALPFTERPYPASPCGIVQVKSYIPPGYDVDHPMVPHGHSVVVAAPAVFRFTGKANPDRHMTCALALALGTDRWYKYDQMTEKAKAEGAGDILADEVLRLMQDLDVPLGMCME
ncbi:hypothetical protein DYB30_004596 [Aphanomyces astaci]|uniref:hydroxyacid-oxoacid transhydrogenase n=1 Tax=Aphanomyces astaci TaxID=112090 RepID=A0A397CJ40_APHAT|nr:hypothetical protein DYB30_004596 [Aphanomyces astaci]